MKFLVDAQLPPALAVWLRARGHEAVPVRDVGLRDANDNVIWQRAAADGAIIVTKDEDFALLAAKDAGPAVLWVRIGNVSNSALIARLEAAWTEVATHLEAGALVVELR